MSLRHAMTLLLSSIVVFSLCHNTRGGGELKLRDLKKGEAQHLEILKKELAFSEWQSKERNGRSVFVTNIDLSLLVPTNVICVSEKIEGEIPTYRVQCTRGSINASAKKIAFNIWICPSVQLAREGIVRRFLNVSAPISYLKEQWKKENVSYGDKNFGSGCWVTGNLVFELTDGADNQDFVKEIFTAIDNALLKMRR